MGEKRNINQIYFCQHLWLNEVNFMLKGNLIVPNLKANLLKTMIPLATVFLTSTAYAANYQPIFEKFTDAKNWTWLTFQTLPKSPNDFNILRKDANFPNRYSIEHTLKDGRITAYGSQSAPNTLVFYSGGWGTTNPANLITLSDVVNPSNLTKLKSNCNFGKISDNYTAKDLRGNRVTGTNYIEYQNVYKWSRTGSTPLFVIEQRGGGMMRGGSAQQANQQGINSSIIITPNLSQLNTAITQHGWHKNRAGKLVSCQFS